jgi:hypothetical protein
VLRLQSKKYNPQILASLPFVQKKKKGSSKKWQNFAIILASF